MATARDYEHALNIAASDLAHIIGLNTADRSIRSPFTRANANLSDWAKKGMSGRSQMVGAGGGGSHDPLAESVVAALDAGRSATLDRAALDHRELVKQTLTAIDAIGRLRKLVDAATTTKPTAAKTLDLDYCKLCALIGSSNVVYARSLCDWCWRLSQRLGLNAEGQPIYPHTELVRRHADGRKVTDTLIAKYHPLPTAGRTMLEGTRQ